MNDRSALYPEELDELVKALLDEVVWARGSGELVTANRGSLSIEGLGAAHSAEPAQRSTARHQPLAALMERQGVSGPQGIDALADPSWSEDEASRRFLAAISGGPADDR